MTTPENSLADDFCARPVAESRTVYTGIVWDVARDTVDFAPGVRFTRDYVAHTGAVAILALTPERDVVVIRQYRHPARAHMWELPAGLLDKAGEDPAVAAVRELEEETGYTAGAAHHLLDYYPSAGGSNEKISVYVAFDCTEAKGVDFERVDEEAEILTRTVPLDELEDAALSGRLQNSALIIATLAYTARVRRGEAPGA